MLNRAHRKTPTASRTPARATSWPSAAESPAPATGSHRREGAWAGNNDPIAYCSRLSRELLLVAWTSDLPAGSSLECRLQAGAGLRNVDVRWLPSEPAARDQDTGGGLVLLTVRLPEDPSQSGEAELGQLELQIDGALPALEVDLDSALVDLRTLIRETVAPLDPEARSRVVEFVATGPVDHGVSLRSGELLGNLHLVREALRERLPAALVVREGPRALAIDTLAAVDETAFYVQGWVRDEESALRRLVAVSPEGERVELQGSLFTYPRPDVDDFYDKKALGPPPKSGFIALFELRGGSRLPEGWVFEAENEEATAVEARAPKVESDAKRVRSLILEGLPLLALPSDDLMSRHVEPAIARLQAVLQATVRVERVVDYGRQPQSPEVSVVIPLYRRIDFVEHQLAQFAHDSELCREELVYVLDSPELAPQLGERAAQLQRLYGCSFKTVLLTENGGFAAANNLGASVASGRLLLFLNSDVLPEQPGWLSELARFYDATPDIGALGPKLLYEDDSIQHAGMFFHLPANTALSGSWANLHYFKGLHRDIPAANVARPVPAVTGACLMVDRELFLDEGGFRNTYVQGDHEDSDLCLRFVERGLENWYFPGVQLRHLEAQSYPSRLRGRTALYNRWIHTRLWDESIRRVMETSENPLALTWRGDS